MKRYLKVDGNLNIRSSSAPVKKMIKKNPLVNNFNIGYYIITPLLVGVFLGLVIDYWLKTKTLFTLVFIGFGTLGSFYNIYRIYKNG